MKKSKSIIEYSGIRIKRGLFKRKINKQLINADVNSACNILKKYLLKDVAKNSKDIYNSILENLVKVCSMPCIKNKDFCLKRFYFYSKQ